MINIIIMIIMIIHILVIIIHPPPGLPAGGGRAAVLRGAAYMYLCVIYIYIYIYTHYYITSCYIILYHIILYHYEAPPDPASEKGQYDGTLEALNKIFRLHFFRRTFALRRYFPMDCHFPSGFWPPGSPREPKQDKGIAGSSDYISKKMNL